MNKEKIKSAIEKTIRYMNSNYYSKFEEKMIVGYLEGALKELEEWKMSVLISPEAYKRLLQGDLDWLLKQPESLEKDHIEAILKNLIKRIEEWKEF